MMNIKNKKLTDSKNVNILIFVFFQLKVVELGPGVHGCKVPRFDFIALDKRFSEVNNHHILRLISVFKGNYRI